MAPEVAVFILLGGYVKSVEAVLAAVGAVITVATGAYLKYRTDLREQSNHLSTTQEKLRATISELQDNVRELNRLWMEENSAKTLAESRAVRREVALNLLKEICPDCYEQIPEHFKI